MTYQPPENKITLVLTREDAVLLLANIDPDSMEPIRTETAYEFAARQDGLAKAYNDAARQLGGVELLPEDYRQKYMSSGRPW